MPLLSKPSTPKGKDARLQSSINVLVVDDMPAIRQMLKRMLLKLGIQGKIREAADGVEAWEALQQETFDLVVCDINMPRLNGLELLRRLRAHPRYETTPFLMITGEVSEDIVAASAESEVDGYLLKPFRLEALINRLQAIISRQRQPSHGEFLFRKAKRLLAAGQPEAALEILERLSMPPYPLQSRVFNLMGKCFQALGSLGEAAVCFDQALELNPRYVQAYHNLAAVMESQGNLAAARRCLEEAQQLSLPSAERLFHLGKLYLREDLRERAKTYFVEAFIRGFQIKDPGQAHTVARTLLSVGLEQEAVEVLRAALDQNPREISLYQQLAEVLRGQEKFQEALDLCQRALEVEPENPRIYFQLGRLWFALGEKDKALKALQTALTLKNHFPEARNFLKQYFPEAEPLSFSPSEV